MLEDVVDCGLAEDCENNAKNVPEGPELTVVEVGLDFFELV
jgi:hypothetical protein